MNKMVKLRGEMPDDIDLFKAWGLVVAGFFCELLTLALYCKKESFQQDDVYFFSVVSLGMALMGGVLVWAWHLDKRIAVKMKEVEND